MTATRHAYRARLFQYVHDPASQERLSIGVALESVGHGYVGAKFIRSVSRVKRAFPETDATQLRRTMKALARVVNETSPGELSAVLAREVPSNFDSGIVLSEEIRGISENPEQSLDALLVRFEVSRQKAARFELSPDRENRLAADVWRDFEELLKGDHVRWRTVEASGRLPHKFPHVWKNGQLNAVEPLSLDLAEEIVHSAAQNAGVYLTLARENKDVKISLLVGIPPAGDERRAEATVGLELLSEDLRGLVEVYSEDQSEKLAQRIREEAHD